MPRTALNKLIPKADYLLVRSFPKVAQRLDKEAHGMDRAEIDAYLKLLPGAIERFQTATVATNDLHESVEVAINQLIISFGSRNAAAVESGPQDDTSNTSLELEETAGSVSEPELPQGSDTSQAQVSNTLPHSDLEAVPGNGGESSDQQARPRNARVGKSPRLSGRARLKLKQQELAESANDRG